MPEQQWRIINDPPLPGKENMKRDLMFLQEVISGEAPPTLRFYTWSPPALSLGYFQKAEETADLAACRRLGVDLVRRPTGGRAVLHHRELTYSIVIPESHPLISEDVLEAYRLLSRGIIDAFASLGIKGVIVSGAERGEGLAPGSCFDSSSAYEVRVRGKKVVGSAQLRRGGVLLQHGAVLLELPLDLYSQVLLSRDNRENAHYLNQLGMEAAGLRDLGYRVSEKELSGALTKGLINILSPGYERPKTTFPYPGAGSSQKTI